ncbi:MAG: hypothetical protein KA785_00490 [Spirochaetaceae bacterium]|nr:hypothetical protein [Spirochaetaceae bacterium]
MKKSILIIFSIILLNHISAKEMELYSNDTGAQEFSELTIEEQYASYMNSFRYMVNSWGQPLKWAKRMVEQYGRGVLPLVDEELENASFDNVYSNENDDPIGVISYIFHALVKRKLLTEDEIILYRKLHEKKIEEYILKYKVIDNTLDLAMKCISAFTSIPSYYVADKKKMIEYYENKLGVKGLQVAEYPQYLK